MRFTRLAAVATAALVASTLTAAPAVAQGKSKPLGTRSLATVLTADKSGFDHNGHDFDILKAAVQAVLKAKPSSPVGVLADGKTRLTAFVPTDRAFQLLVADIQNSKRLPSEKKTFAAVAGLGIDTVETVLLYHVVPGVRVTKARALKADGARLKTAAGKTIKVNVYGHRHPRIALIDADRSDRNPRVTTVGINRGNRQLAHAIDRVLRPVNLP